MVKGVLKWPGGGSDMGLEHLVLPQSSTKLCAGCGKDYALLSFDLYRFTAGADGVIRGDAVFNGHLLLRGDDAWRGV